MLDTSWEQFGAVSVPIGRVFCVCLGCGDCGIVVVGGEDFGTNT